MKVQAAKGTKCPMEGRPRQYITDGKPVEVPGTAYYRRLLNDGSLVEITPAQPATTKGAQ
ncbi:MAG: DUF2635 domain-containing protein [Desulfobulbus sp.]|jgi:hypothetical protein|uniref:hypothetical protein n=1 Tax=Desulfobulbus sp. TaxID=895 RepID=UPI00284B79A5|nr:hypothetical protein [Desulfobulbus sp.]MDR2551452.1 DUF2635 domain-containing protein [Desulfobulbus sp.]